MAKQVILDTWSDLIARSEEIYQEYLIDLDNKTVTKKDIDDKIDKALSESEFNTDINVDNKISTAISAYEEKDDAQELALINGLYNRIIEELNGRGYITITAAEQKIQAEIAKVINGASENFDTLKEISDWISSHGSSAAAMNSQIKKNEADIFTIQTEIEDINNSLATKESITEHTYDFNTLSVNLANTTIALRDYIDSSISRVKDIVDTKVDKSEYETAIASKVSTTDFDSTISSLNSSLATKVDSATYDEDMLVMKTAIADNTGSATGIKAALEQLEKNLKKYADDGDKAHNTLDIEIDGKLDISVYDIDKENLVSSINSKVDITSFNSALVDIADAVDTKVDSSVYNNEVIDIYNEIDSKVDSSVYEDAVANIESEISNLNVSKVDVSVYNKALIDIATEVDSKVSSDVYNKEIAKKLDVLVFNNTLIDIADVVDTKLDISTFDNNVSNIEEQISTLDSSLSLAIENLQNNDTDIISELDTKVSKEEHSKDITRLSNQKVDVSIYNNALIDIADAIDSKVDNEQYVYDSSIINKQLNSLSSSIETKVSSTEYNSEISNIKRNKVDVSVYNNAIVNIANTVEELETTLIDSISTKVDVSVYDEDIDDINEMIVDIEESLENKINQKLDSSIFYNSLVDITNDINTKVDVSTYENNIETISETIDNVEESLDNKISQKLDSSLFYESLVDIANDIITKVDVSTYENNIETISETIDNVEESLDNKINQKLDSSVYNDKIAQLDSSIAEIKTVTEQVNVATSDILGMIKVGNDFDITEDGVLTLYQKPTVSSFKSNCDNNGANSSNTFEKGTVINKIVLTWTLNKTAKTIKVGSDDVTGTNSKTYDNLSLTADKSYTLKFTDARNAEAAASTAIYFRNKIYLGTSPKTVDFDSDFIISLSNKVFATNNSAFGTKTISAGATEYIYYAAPTSFSKPGWSDGAGIYTFDKMSSFDFTNVSGYTENYTVWRASDAPGLKNQKIIIS